MSVLVLVEHDGSAIKDATLAAITAAGKLGEVHALVAGTRSAGSPAAAKIAGVARFSSPMRAHLEHDLAENVAPVAVKLMAGYDAFVAPATTFGKNIAPRVAALLDVMQVSDIIAVEDAGHVHPAVLRRQRDRDSALERREEGITVRGTAFEKAAREGGSAPIEYVDAGSDAGTSNFVGLEASESERPELTSAKIIVSGGRAFGSSEQFHALLDPLADKLGAGGRREPRRGRRGLCAQRLPGRPDRQDRRPRSLYRDRHLGRDPAPCGHEGFEGHRRHQQGRGSTDLPGRGHRPGRRPVQDRPRADGEALSLD